MDVYGGCRLEDAGLIADTLLKNSTATFSYRPSEYTQQVITITYVKHSSVVGKITMGGDPRGKYMVSILYRGAFHFHLDAGATIYTDYVQEKLGLEEPDAEGVAALLSAIASIVANGCHDGTVKPKGS